MTSKSTTPSGPATKGPKAAPCSRVMCMPALQTTSPQVISGEMTCGDVVCTAGMHITLEQGAAFGPFVAGPEGVVLFEVMMGDPRSWPADPEGFEKLLAEKGARKLPNPPIDLPDWIKDTRSE